MSENHTQENGPSLLTALRRSFRFDERWRFILLFLVINLLIFILIWLSWQNQVLVRKVSVLETQLVVVPQTRVVEAVTTCEVDCTDKMVTMAARQGEKIAQVTATMGALITRFPTPGTPTGTPAWTATPPPTFTPIPSPTPPMPTETPTWTPTSPPTPTATPTHTPKPKPPTPKPPPPVVLGITPAATVRSDVGPSFPVTITGEHFASNASARLGADIPITVTDIPVTTTIFGKLSPNMPVGVYGLTVTNLDAPDPPGTLPPAFTVYSRPVSILESPYVVTCGRDAQLSYDLSWSQVQLIFFEVPGSLNRDLYIHIFDADTGGPTVVDYHGGDDEYTTTMTYTLYGLTGAYTAPEARFIPPSPAGITSGTVITRVTIGENPNLDNKWGYQAQPPFFLGPFSPSKGEGVGDRLIFKLVVEGGNGNDRNWYRVALSTQPNTNTVPYDARMFAFSWTGLVHNVHQPDLRLHPYVTSTTAMTLESLGCASDGEPLWVRTPFRNVTSTCSSEEGRFMPERLGVGEGERGMTWTLDLCGYTASAKGEYLVFWAEDGISSALPIFTRPTIRTPP